MILPVCNQKPDRAPKIFGHTFFLCWRCTMAAFAIIITLFFAIIFSSVFLNVKFVYVGFLLCIPMIIDGFLQYFMDVISTNFRRAVTGCLFGIGITLWIAYFVNSINN